MLSVVIITAYPKMFPGVLSHSIIGKALSDGKWKLNIINLHDYGYNARKSIDDKPFGGGPGMVIRPDVIEKALTLNKNLFNEKYTFIYLSPSGNPLKQHNLELFSKKQGLVILCGRFEGVDARVIEKYQFNSISMGDYILNGGEVAAQALVEGCIRLIPGVLGHSDSILEESFSNNLLEHPHYTRPKNWLDNDGKVHSVPEVLISGHHEDIKQWRKKKSEEITKKIRSDLIKK
ncbi:MAG: tRNA (guanine-N(1)-)-methyltransferase [Alphaproteobacteria bacterium MarineAlpha5_Bin9]|nr:MAG: tRNA (guanine-N(1)-)-methyltransferase [Alphaproteobacteria bacterium MarineAlpha5_Bin9]|tara:strand:+ start:139 stop:837 length:699 start_codon:yes stop_codon:yes gene_type:complete